MQQASDEPGRLRSTSGTHIDRGGDVRHQDAVDLARVGKKQVLERRFGLLSMVGFSCLITISWEGVLVNLSLGLQNGGPAGLIYGYLLAWLGTLSVFMALGELSSMYPTAGGQYHWVSVLAPKSARDVLSYITGWATVVSWVAGVTADSFFTGTLIQATISLNDPSYEAKGWQGTLIMWCVLILSTIITTTLGTMLPAMEIMLLVVHVLGFFGTMIPLAYHAGSGHLSGSNGRARAHEIFTSFYNLGGWSSQAIAFLIGIQGNATALIGLDGAIHMSEEVERSSVNVARSLMYTAIINGALGFAMLITVLLAADNLELSARSGSKYPFIDIIADSLGSIGGATAIVILIILMNFANTVAALSSASRMTWSFARDRGLPGWRWLRRVDKRTSIPFNTIFVATVTAAAIGTINIGSIKAFQDVVSLVLEGFYTSYLFAVSLLLYRRFQGHIIEPNQESPSAWIEGEMLPLADHMHVWGPWRVKGWVGTLNNIVAVIYLLVIGFFCFWPTEPRVTAANMNYSVVVLGCVMVGSLIWYLVGARKSYSGPIIEVQVVKGGVPHPLKESV